MYFFFEHSSSGDGDSEGGGDNGGGGGHVFHPPRNMVLDPSLDIYMNRGWVREYFWWTSNFPMHQKESRKKI